MRWPWISILLGVLAAASPLGREVFHDAFFSGEALSRNIAQPLFFMALALLALIVAAEWLVRLLISKRRARGTTT
jgi:flagellar biogenesis protein FliO